MIPAPQTNQDICERCRGGEEGPASAPREHPGVRPQFEQCLDYPSGVSVDEAPEIAHLLDERVGGFSKATFQFAFAELLFRTNRLEDAPLLTMWFNDHDNTQWMDDPGTVYTLEQVTESINNPDPWALDMSVEYQNRAIGYCSIYEIDISTRSAEISFLIGERASQGQGLGRKMVSGLCTIGFDVLRLNQLKAYVVRSNIRSMKALCDAGFKVTGERGKHNPHTASDDVEVCLARWRA